MSEKKTAVVVAVPATAAVAISGEKQGAKCCEFSVISLSSLLPN